MGPEGFLEFRDPLAPASGFQSRQFRAIEARLPAALRGVLRRRGAAARARSATTSAIAALADLYRDHEDDPLRAVRHQVCELLVDHDETIQNWRFHHTLMAAREIGSRAGTGGSRGVEYLRGTVDRRFYEELWEVGSRSSPDLTDSPGVSDLSPGLSHAATLDRLRGLLDVAAAVRTRRRAARGARLGGRRHRRPARLRRGRHQPHRPAWDDFEVVVVLGNEEARALLMGQTSRRADWDPLLAPRFLRHGAYFVPRRRVRLEPRRPAGLHARDRRSSTSRTPGIPTTR